MSWSGIHSMLFFDSKNIKTNCEIITTSDSMTEEYNVTNAKAEEEKFFIQSDDFFKDSVVIRQSDT